VIVNPLVYPTAGRIDGAFRGSSDAGLHPKTEADLDGLTSTYESSYFFGMITEHFQICLLAPFFIPK